MDEIEVKILEINKTEIEKKLLEMGAQKVFDDQLDAVLLDLPDLSLANSGRMLRVRKEGSRQYLTLKKGKSDQGIKIAEEFEVEVLGFEETIKIFEGLGFKIYFKYKKHRTTYELDQTEFSIDTPEGDLSDIPTLLEIEGESQEKVFEWAEKLGFSKQDCKGWGLNGLLKHYGKAVPGIVI